MCLTKKRRLPKISRKPITVYKIIEKWHGGYVTPVMGEPVKLNSVLKAKNTSLWEMLFGNIIKGCGVHAYISKMEALRGKPFVFYKCVVECTIPPYTLYWEGLNDDIAARKLVITDKFID